MKKTDFFICIEGLDKSGKTTQSVLLVEALRKNGFDAAYTTEPSSGEIGKFIRTYVLRRKQRIPVAVEALLFAADRIEHIENEIKPMLRENKIVVSDRYLYSSLAYQGAVGLDLDWLLEINRLAPTPDLAIYLDVPLEVVSQRCKSEKSVMEQPDIQRKVQEVYKRLVREGKMVPIDGNRPREVVAKDVQALVMKRLGCLKRPYVNRV
ncbi:MAG: dTMP kinase [Candidatus Bathyarchaeia archaeon]